MKLAVVGVAAFVVGVAGGTVLSPARHAIPVDTTQVAAGEHVEGGDSAAVEDPAHVAPTGEVEAPVSAPEITTPHVPDAAEASDASGASSAEEIQAISTAIAKLSAADAGPMVARLSDADALAVLKAVPLPRASKILDTMSPEQAARLSKQLLLAGANR